MRYLLIAIVALWMGDTLKAQTASSNFNFIEYQRSFPRISEALKKKEDTLKKQFEEKRLPWPAKYVYLRSFKYDSQLEVWVKYDMQEKYRLFKTYKVCALAGTLGPKRMQGDYQVPEGFYYINEFNPKSQYHLSLGLNYPNVSDKILSDSQMPGGDIYIHGSCVTTGCIPVQDSQIEELYILAAHAKNHGQDFIPVHIFPIRFHNQKSTDYLNKYMRDFPEYSEMAGELKHAYEYFEKTHELPIIMVNKKGGYIVDGIIPAKEEKKMVKKVERRPVKEYNEAEIAKVVDKLPVYPGGSQAFQSFLDGITKEMVKYLEEEQPKTFVMIEFVLNKEGKTIYARVLQGGNADINNRLEERFENMPNWEPAVRSAQPVSIKLKQSIYIEKSEPVVVTQN